MTCSPTNLSTSLCYLALLGCPYSKSPPAICPEILYSFQLVNIDNCKQALAYIKETCVRLGVFLHICKSVYISCKNGTYGHAYTYTYAHTHAHTCPYACTYVCIYIPICIKKAKSDIFIDIAI